MLFRPKRTIKTPSGDYWELYTTKTVVSPRKQRSYDDELIGYGGIGAELSLIETVISFVGDLLISFVRLLFLWPGAFVKGHRSNLTTIIAVADYPSKERLTWTTTDDKVEQALDSLEATFKEGKRPQPAAVTP